MNRMMMYGILAAVVIAGVLAVAMPLEQASTIHPRTFTSGAIADGSITNTKLAADSVTTDKILADTILAADIAAGAVDTAELAAGSVTTTEIAAGTITGADIAAGGIDASGDFAAGVVDSAAIGASQVTSGKIPTFVSGTVTGTGAAQTTAHGLGATPTVFFALLVNDPATVACSITAVSADGTDLTATVPATCDYRWFAIGP